MKAAIALALMAATAAGGPDTIPAPAGTISMEMNSWGKRVSDWSIDPGGNGRYAAAVPTVFAPDAHWIVRKVAVGPAGYRKLRGALAAVEHRPAGALPCTIAITDGAYGQVRWTQLRGKHRAVDYTAGCREPATQSAVGAIMKADAMMRRWSAGGRIIEDRKVKP
ncbi:hypothetical protein MZO42_16920 [Sphingomonas psychrotolerans]|uniref:Uncharacterized protein n=1 Tax=Sphingomonas psychrotolerans TaxID=1327635 RepID=A0ABU3N7T9_9SPHN|nr:hypothetical protein [Sphingomonas psychrotolerans]MDT8760386.1 hypothetical protein [Sphingomonas psychrotolerans]